MNEELSTALAERIQQAHQDALSAADNARNQIGEALEKAADVGLLVAEAADTYKGRLNQWLRDNVQGLTVEQAEVYRGIHNVRKKRECLLADTRQLKLIGIIGIDEQDQDSNTASAQSTRAGRDHWLKWTAHVAHHFAEMDKTRPIEQLEEFERKSIALQLEPIVKLYMRAGGASIIRA